ncbi:hypothetical protein BD779DRAFT_1505407 [Infundibulicybe gibba]|nr:hypothetical protein BD779DRAFT_1505407 [Infundibulicybe gibba]
MDLIAIPRVLNDVKIAVRGHNETSCRSSERPGIDPARERDASMIVRAPLTTASRALRDPASIMPSNKSLATTLNQQQDTPNKKSDSRKVGETVQQTAVVSRVSEEDGKTSTPLRPKRTRVGSDGGTDVPAKQRKYDHPVKPPKGKLSGLEVVHMDYLPLSVDGSPRLDWMQLRDILLRTGRDRAQAEDGLDVH